MLINPKKPDVTVDEVGLVLIGDFNPKIFHPMWFVHHELLRRGEAEDARIEVVHQDVAAFVTNWLSVQVLRDRFTAKTKADIYHPHLNDLVQSVFHLLSHTPVRQLGINVIFRLNFKSEQDLHSFGHFIAPKSQWHGVIRKPGLRNIQMQGTREDANLGFIIISIEPDLSKRNEAIILVNDHYEIPSKMTDQKLVSAGALWAVEILRENYNTSIKNAQAISDNMIKNYLSVNEVDNGE